MGQRLAARCLRIIDRYQASDKAKRTDGSCRFRPSCCTYMREAFTTRSFIVAWFMSAWRLIRCNPLTRPYSQDPVKKARLRPRANALRTVFAVLFLSGMMVLLIGSVASAQSLEGGCNANINGTPPTEMERASPLVVHEGESVTVTGIVPSQAVTGDPDDIKSLTTVDVWFVEPFFKFSSNEAKVGTGPSWTGSVNPEKYMKYGSGLYKAEGRATITSGGSTITCIADGYLKLDGARIVQAAAGGVATVGLFSAVAAPGMKKAKNVTTTDLGAALDADIKTPGGLDGTVPTVTKVEPAPQTSSCCGYRPYHPMVPGAFGMFKTLTLGMLPFLVGMAGGGGKGGKGKVPPPPEGEPPAEEPVPTPANVASAPAPGTVLYSRLAWRRGHTIWGFIGGLFFGLGLTIVIQQQGIWILNIWNAIVLPVGLAILSGIRARIGRAYRVVVRAA